MPFVFGSGISFTAFYLLFSQLWFATPQLVLQADWQDVWHSPQPPFLALSQRLRVANVLILLMVKSPFNIVMARGCDPQHKHSTKILS